MKKLKNSEIKQGLNTIAPEWTTSGKFIERKFIFNDFTEAFSFMTKVAFLAEKFNHHPNWENGYNKVKIRLTTHECEGLTELDFILAKKIDNLLKGS